MVVLTSEGGILIGNGELFVIHELRHQGLSISAIARHTGLARKTVRKYLKQGLQAPRYGPRGSWVRLARVCLRMRLPSRQAFRNRMAGGLLRLGMASMW